MIKLAKITKLILFLNIILLLFQVIMASRLSTRGITVNKLVEKQQSLNQENFLLERKIATLSALTYLSQKASQNGFVKARPIYLPQEYPVALKN